MQSGCQFTIMTNDNFSLQTPQAILGIGSLIRQQLPAQIERFDTSMVIQDIYLPNCDYHIQSIKDNFPDKHELNVLIVGGNASAVEVIFLLQNSLYESGFFCNFTSVNSLGTLPGSFDSEIESKFYRKASSAQNEKSEISAMHLDSFKTDF